MSKSMGGDNAMLAAEQAEAFDIGPVLAIYEAEKRPGDPEARRLWRELVRFLMMTAHAEDSGYGMHGPADTLWHHFVLHTALYQAFCERHAGGFLHHHPGTSDRGAGWRANYLRFLVDYRAVFGEAPPDDIWPLPIVPGVKLPKSAAGIRPRHVKAMTRAELGSPLREGGMPYPQSGHAGCGAVGCGGMGFRGDGGAGGGGSGGDAGGGSGGDGGGCGGGCSG